MPQTPNHGFPLMGESQAGKYLTYNTFAMELDKQFLFNTHTFTYDFDGQTPSSARIILGDLPDGYLLVASRVSITTALTAPVVTVKAGLGSSDDDLFGDDIASAVNTSVTRYHVRAHNTGTSQITLTTQNSSGSNVVATGATGVVKIEVALIQLTA